MTHTSKLTVVTQAAFDLVNANKIALGLADVWYGEQLRIPDTPAVAIESGNVHRELAGVGAQGRVLNTFTIYIIGYLSKLEDNQITRKEVDELMEAVEAKFTADVTLGGVVIHGFVTDFEPGYTTRQGDSYRVCRLTWQGITKTNLV